MKPMFFFWDVLGFPHNWRTPQVTPWTPRLPWGCPSIDAALPWPPKSQGTAECFATAAVAGYNTWALPRAAGPQHVPLILAGWLEDLPSGYVMLCCYIAIENWTWPFIIGGFSHYINIGEFPHVMLNYQKVEVSERWLQTIASHAAAAQSPGVCERDGSPAEAKCHPNEPSWAVYIDQSENTVQVQYNTFRKTFYKSEEDQNSLDPSVSSLPQNAWRTVLSREVVMYRIIVIHASRTPLALHLSHRINPHSNSVPEFFV